MAQESRYRQSPDALKNEIARSREQITREFRGLRYEADIPRRIRRSLRQNTGMWIGAAAVVGALIVFLPVRRREVHVDLAHGGKIKPRNKLLETGFLFGVARIAFTMLKPTITKFVLNKMRKHSGPREGGFKW